MGPGSGCKYMYWKETSTTFANHLFLNFMCLYMIEIASVVEAYTEIPEIGS